MDLSSTSGLDVLFTFGVTTMVILHWSEILKIALELLAGVSMIAIIVLIVIGLYVSAIVLTILSIWVIILVRPKD